jgi:hypothetical protein
MQKQNYTVTNAYKSKSDKSFIFLQAGIIRADPNPAFGENSRDLSHNDFAASMQVMT